MGMIGFRIYYTFKENVQYCDEDGVRVLGDLIVELPGTGFDKLSFGFAFGQMEITITVKNETNGQTCGTSFELSEIS